MHCSSYFNVLLYQSFGDCTKSANYNWYYSHFHVPLVFEFSSKVQVLSFFLLAFNFTLWSAGTAKPIIWKVLLYIYITELSELWAPPWGLSSLAKELPAAASVMESSSKELSTLVADRV